MNLDQITTEPWILALFIRDDGERFLLGDGGYVFTNKQLHFAGNRVQSDTVDMQGSDGVLVAGQVRRAATQSFKGYIGDGSTSPAIVERLRRDFFAFFRPSFFYSVVYIFCDGSAIKRQRGFIVEAPEVKELYGHTPEYSVGLNFEDVNYYEYSEDSEGEEEYVRTLESITATQTQFPTTATRPVDTISALDSFKITIETVGDYMTNDFSLSKVGEGRYYYAAESSLSGGHKLIITVDRGLATATLDGTPVELTATTGFALTPGDNSFRFTSSGGSGRAVATIEYSGVVG